MKAYRRTIKIIENVPVVPFSMRHKMVQSFEYVDEIEGNSGVSIYFVAQGRSPI